MEYVGAEKTAVYLAAATDSPPAAAPSLNGWYNPALLWLSLIYEQAVKENQPIQPALLEVQQLFDAYRTCVMENDAFNDAPAWQACASATDERLQARYGSEN